MALRLLRIATRLPRGKLWLGCMGGEELECLSSSLQLSTSPLHRLLPGWLQGLPAGPSLHVTPCRSALSAPPSHTGAPPVPPPPIPAHTLGSSEQRKP